jgi:hypothetical protein
MSSKNQIKVRLPQNAAFSGLAPMGHPYGDAPGAVTLDLGYYAFGNLC